MGEALEQVLNWKPNVRITYFNIKTDIMTTLTTAIHDEDLDIDRSVLIVDREAFEALDTTDWEEIYFELAEEDLDQYGLAFLIDCEPGYCPLDRHTMESDYYYVMENFVCRHFPEVKEQYERERRESEESTSQLFQ